MFVSSQYSVYQASNCNYIPIQITAEDEIIIYWIYVPKSDLFIVYNLTTVLLYCTCMHG